MLAKSKGIGHICRVLYRKNIRAPTSEAPGGKQTLTYGVPGSVQMKSMPGVECVQGIKHDLIAFKLFPAVFVCSSAL